MLRVLFRHLSASLFSRENLMAHLATDAKHIKIYLLNPIMGSVEQQSCMFGYLFQLHGQQDILCQTV